MKGVRDMTCEIDGCEGRAETVVWRPFPKAGSVEVCIDCSTGLISRFGYLDDPEKQPKLSPEQDAAQATIEAVVGAAAAQWDAHQSFAIIDVDEVPLLKALAVGKFWPGVPAIIHAVMLDRYGVPPWPLVNVSTEMSYFVHVEKAKLWQRALHLLGHWWRRERRCEWR